MVRWARDPHLTTPQGCSHTATPREREHALLPPALRATGSSLSGFHMMSYQARAPARSSGAPAGLGRPPAGLRRPTWGCAAPWGAALGCKSKIGQRGGYFPVFFYLVGKAPPIRRKTYGRSRKHSTRCPKFQKKPGEIRDRVERAIWIQNVKSACKLAENA